MIHTVTNGAGHGEFRAGGLRLTSPRGRGDNAADISILHYEVCLRKVTPAMVSNATCANCHAPLPAEARVCPKCGTPVAQKHTPGLALDPAAWAAFGQAATPHAGSNGNAPVADPAPAS